MKRGSRFLNDNGSVLGLNTSDLISAVAVLVFSSEILKPIKLDFLSVPLALFSLIALIPIRLRFRRKIIRDFVLFFIGARLVGSQNKKGSHSC